MPDGSAAPQTTNQPANNAPANNAPANSPAPNEPGTLTTADDPAKAAAEAQAAADAAAKAEANAKAAEAAKAEETRRAALTQEERDAEDKAKADEAAKAGKKDGAPEKYEAFTVPEGVAIDAEITTAFEAKAKSLNLSQEDAQELIDLSARATLKDRNAFTEQVTQTQASWLAASQADKEFGGDNLAENMAVAKKALNFATPEFKTMLTKSRLGDHPEMVRFMFRIGKAMSEDGFVRGQQAASAERDRSDAARASRIYGGNGK